MTSSESIFLVTGGYDHTIRFWETLTGTCYRHVQHNESQVNRLEITPDKRSIAAAGNPHVRLYDIESSKSQPDTSFDGHSNNVTAVGFQTDNKWMYTGSEDGTVKIWDFRGPGCQREYKHRAMVETAVLHPNQVEILSGDQSGRLWIWDLRANNCSEQLIPEPDAAMRSVCISANGLQMAAATNTGNVYVWNTESSTIGKNLSPLTSYPNHDKKQILKTKFSPDMKSLVTCSADKTCKVWDTRDWSLKKTLTGHSSWVWDCEFSADSEYLVTASSDRTARLWDLTKGDTVRMFSGNQKAVTCLALQDESLSAAVHNIQSSSSSSSG